MWLLSEVRAFCGGLCPYPPGVQEYRFPYSYILIFIISLIPSHLINIVHIFRMENSLLHINLICTTFMVVHFNFAKDLLSFFLIVEWVVGTRSVWMGQGKGSQYTYLILKVKEKAVVAKCCLLFTCVLSLFRPRQTGPSGWNMLAGATADQVGQPNRVLQTE